MVIPGGRAQLYNYDSGVGSAFILGGPTVT